MIYALLAFFMVATAALGGVLYARSGDRKELEAEWGRAVQLLKRDDDQIRASIADLERKIVNLPGAEISARIVALERAREDSKRPAIVRVINEARRMANQMGGVEGVANAS